MWGYLVTFLLGAIITFGVCRYFDKKIDAIFAILQGMQEIKKQET